MSATGAVIARILTQYSDKGSKEAQKDIARLTKKFDDFGRKAKKSFGIAIAATATLAVKISKDAVQAAIEDSKSQAVLAMAMANTTGATKDAIAAAEDYVKATMFRVSVADDELRASLAQLYIATGDLTEAERLQTIALDVAAATGTDLARVSDVMAKAQQGNVDAIKKLTPELSGLIGKATKAEDIFAILASTYYGSAEALANLDPLKKLKLAYGEVLETLGYALLPVVKELTEYIINNVLPAFDGWLEANGEELAQAIRDIADGIIFMSGTFKTIAQFIKDNEFLIKLAINLFAVGRGLKAASTVMRVVDKLFTRGVKTFKTFKSVVGDLKSAFQKLLDKFFDAIKGDNTLGKLVGLLGKGADAVSKLVTGFLGLGLVQKLGIDAFKALFGIEDELGKAADKATKKTYNQMRAEQIKAEADKKRAEALAKARAIAAAAAAKAAAEEKKAAEEQAAIDAKVLSIKKSLNITAKSAIDKENDLIQLGAAEFFLKKQGIVAKEELAKLERLKEENFLLEVRQTLALRYADIQKVIADQKLDLKEIQDLSDKWGISNSSVEMYIHLVQSINDGTISNEEVEKLAQMWGSSNEQAKAFLETYLRIHDGLLTEAEVFDLLQQGWAKTEEEVRIYADAVAIIHDGIAKDADFERLATKWDLSKQEVNKYVASMGAKFDYQGTFLDPVIALAAKWDLATAALKRYLEMLKSGKGFTFGDPNSSVVPVTPVTPDNKIISDAAQEAIDAAEAAADAANALAESIDALIKSDPLAAIRDAATTEDINKAVAEATKQGKSASDIANAMMTGLLGQGVDAANAASSARYTGQAIAAMQQQAKFTASYAAFKAKERADEMAAAVASSSTSAYDPYADEAEKARIRRMQGYQSSTLSNASGISGGNLIAAPIVNVTVQGSVTSEQDLVQAVRDGLLATQYNGSAINLQAV